MASFIVAPDLVFPASGYVANAIEVTFNTDRLDSGATFAPSGETVSLSVWLRRNGNLATRQFFFGSLGVRIEIGFDTANRFHADFWDAGQTAMCALDSSAITDTNWHHYAVSVDLNGVSAGDSITNLYVDGVSDKTVATDTITSDMDLADHYSIGNNQGGTGLGFDGDFSEFWMSDEFVDFSDGPTLAKFISGGKPVDLGSDGSTPTGTAPEIYSKSAAASITTNSGSDADFTVGTGTFTDAATSPSD